MMKRVGTVSIIYSVMHDDTSDYSLSHFFQLALLVAYIIQVSANLFGHHSPNNTLPFLYYSSFNGAQQL